MDELLLMTLALVIANGVFDAVVVAYLAGRRSKKALVDWMQSKEAVPYMDMIADRAMLRITPIFESSKADTAALRTTMNERISSLKADLKTDLQRTTENIEDLICGINIPEIPAMPTPDFSPLLLEIKTAVQTLIDEQTAGLSEQMLDSVKKSQLALQSAALRANAGAMGDLDSLIEESGQGIIDEAIASGGARSMLKAQILGQGLPKNYQKTHPIGSMVLQAGKVALCQAIDSGIVDQYIPGNAATINNNTSPNSNKTNPIRFVNPYE